MPFDQCEDRLPSAFDRLLLSPAHCKSPLNAANRVRVSSACCLTSQMLVATIEARIGDALGPFRAAVSLLTTTLPQRDHGARLHR